LDKNNDGVIESA